MSADTWAPRWKAGTSERVQQAVKQYLGAEESVSVQVRATMIPAPRRVTSVYEVVVTNQRIFALRVPSGFRLGLGILWRLLWLLVPSQGPDVVFDRLRRYVTATRSRSRISLREVDGQEWVLLFGDERDAKAVEAALSESP